MKFLPYHPDQPWLLPPRVKDVLGEDHLCFFVHEVVERLDLHAFTTEYGEEGQRPYDPALMVKVWLYAYALQITSSRRLEQRIKEDLPLRFLAGNSTPDHWRRRRLIRSRPGGTTFSPERRKRELMPVPRLNQALARVRRKCGISIRAAPKNSSDRNNEVLWSWRRSIPTRRAAATIISG